MKSKSEIPYNVLIIAGESEGLKLISRVVNELDITSVISHSVKEMSKFVDEVFSFIVYITERQIDESFILEFSEILIFQVPLLIVSKGEINNSLIENILSYESVDIIDISDGEMILKNRIKIYKELVKSKWELKKATEDIENKKKRIADEDQKFKIVTSTIIKPIIFVDQDLNITFWNNDAQNLLGYTRFEVVNENFLRWVISPASHEQISTLFKDAASEGSRKIKRTYQFTVKTKLKVELEVDATISYLKTGAQTFHLIFVFHDYSNERRLEKEKQKVSELHEENKLLHEFTHHISHELRTPLNAIMGISKTLMKYNAINLAEKQKEGLNIIYKCGTQLTGMISDLLNLSRMDSNRLKLNEDIFNFDKFISLQKSQVLQLIENKPIKLYIKKSQSIPDELKADERKIGQVLTNLLSNSVKFTEKGKIVLSCHLVDNKLFFEIVDTGIGIPASKMKIIFEKFRQVDESVFNTMGAGLGLHISKKLVDLMHGEITAESEEGIGTIVRFYVTLSEDAIPVKKIAIADDTSTSDLTFFKYKIDSRLILIIDDSIQNSFLYSVITEQTDYSTILCKKGKVGLSAALEFMPDIIILKLEIPGLHGTSIIRELENKQVHIPILALSEYENPAFILPPHVKFLPGAVNAEQILELLNGFPLKEEKPNYQKMVIYESQSWLLNEGILYEDALFIDNKHPDHTFIQIFRRKCESLIFEQADRNNYSMELFLRILSEGKPEFFKEIIVQYEGVPMKFITRKTENYSNIRLLKKEEIINLFQMK